MPNLASTLARISGGSLRDISNGLPGAARIIKKAAVTTRNRVGIATSSRRRRNRSMEGPPGRLYRAAGAVAKLPFAPDVVKRPVWPALGGIRWLIFVR